MLLSLIYVAYIGLGVPDALFGAAWPLFCQEFGFSEGIADLLFLPISVGNVLSAASADRLIRIFGTARLTAVSTALTAAGLLSFSLAKTPVALCAAGICLGIGAGAVDTALADFVLGRYGVRHLHFLHCFHGLGVSFSPAVLSRILASGGSWRDGYLAAFAVQAGIALLVTVGLPLWRRDRGAISAAETVLPKATKPFFLCAVVAFAAGTIEYTAGLWGASYLQHLGTAPETTAAYTAVFYALMALARFLAGIGTARLPAEKQIIISAVLLAAGCFVFIIFPGSPAGLLLIGFAVAPVLPNLLQLSGDGSPTGKTVAASYVGVTLGPMLFGRIAAPHGIGTLPLFLIFAAVVLLFGAVRLRVIK